MPEAQQPYYFDYLLSLFLKDLGEHKEYISGRTAISYVSYKQLSSCWSVELLCIMPEQAPGVMQLP